MEINLLSLFSIFYHCCLVIIKIYLLSCCCCSFFTILFVFILYRKKSVCRTCLSTVAHICHIFSNKLNWCLIDALITLFVTAHQEIIWCARTALLLSTATLFNSHYLCTEQIRIAPQQLCYGSLELSLLCTDI